ncbi:MAG: hypothetical protein RSF34_21130 [Flavobacterium sp.]|uniref:hypothetical protein n=1 Tax=Flavobacterium sp. TaxID=239 RepID=UPI002FC8B8EF
MTKKLILYLLGILILFAIGFFIYGNLPLEISRKEDIAFGNILIKNIEKYKLDHAKLPTEDDWSTLKKLGFQTQELEKNPIYTADSKGNYEITFVEGFDPPYLIWNSIDRKWKIGFPKILSDSVETDLLIFEGNQILFIRPSEEKFESLKEEDGIYEVDSDFGFAIQQTMDSLRLKSKYKDLKFKVITDRFIEIKDSKKGPLKIDTDTLLYTTVLTSPGKEIQIIKMIHSMGYLDPIDEFYNIK